MKGNILIVDDESGALKLLKELLGAEGYAVRPFNNGELALRSIVAEAPELIMLDIRMPGMDGFEACRRIKQDVLLKDIPVIFISAATDAEDKVKAFQTGGVDYITKPFQKEEVLARVQAHVTLYRTLQKMKQISDALREREEIFRGLFENMSSAVAIYDAVDNGEDFIFRDFNRSGELIDHVKREQLIGRKLTEEFPNIKEFGLVDVLRRVWQTGRGEHFPVAFYEDERVSGWRDNYVFRLPSGEVVAIYDDITERKRAEQAVKDSHESLQLLLDSMAEGAYGVDTNGNCTFVNRAFLQLLGYQDASEVIGRHIHELIHHTRPNGQPYPGSECRMYGAYQARRPVNVSDEVFWRKDGGSIPVEYWSYPIIKDDVVIGAIATFIDITERKKAAEEIHNLAFYDTLTHLANRRLLTDRLKQALAASKRSGHFGALMFLDLDNFKSLNDTQGHDVGDKLLLEVAHRIKSCVREMDTVARFGGDEFVVMLGQLDADQDTAIKHAGTIAEKVRAMLAEPYLLAVRKHGNENIVVAHHCSSSIGVVVFNHALSVEDILKRADIAMYQAKESGRNLVRFFDVRGDVFCDWAR